MERHWVERRETGSARRRWLFSEARQQTRRHGTGCWFWRGRAYSQGPKPSHGPHSTKWKTVSLNTGNTTTAMGVALSTTTRGHRNGGEGVARAGTPLCQRRLHAVDPHAPPRLQVLLAHKGAGRQRVATRAADTAALAEPAEQGGQGRRGWHTRQGPGSHGARVRPSAIPSSVHATSTWGRHEHPIRHHGVGKQCRGGREGRGAQGLQGRDPGLSTLSPRVRQPPPGRQGPGTGSPRQALLQDSTGSE